MPEPHNAELPPTALTDALRERLFRSRTLVIAGEINQKVAADVIAQLIALAGESDDPITIYINSQGGHVESGDTIHDLIRFIKPRVRMIGTRSEEHTSELQSRENLVCRLLLEKKKKMY